MSHPCPVRDCTATVDDSMLMDARHWRLVPGPLQRAVYGAYDHGRGLGTPALARAQDAAVRAVDRRLGGDGP